MTLENLLSLPPKGSKIAIICGLGIGDGIICVNLAQQLESAGYSVTVYSSSLCELNELFKLKSIKKSFTFASSYQDYLNTFDLYDFIICFPNTPHSDHLPLPHKTQPVSGAFLNSKLTLGENLRLWLSHWLNRENISSLPELHFEKPKPFSYLIAIHPTSNSEEKNWPIEKYIELSQEIRKEGFRCHFFLGPNEEKERAALLSARQVVIETPSLIDLAHELSRYSLFIGNDSGLGHLASLLGLPTLSIFASRRYSKIWRPNWGDNTVIAPPIAIPFGRLKQKIWKKTIFVSQVLGAATRVMRQIKNQRVSEETAS